MPTKPRTSTFDPKAFLAKFGDGKAVAKIAPNQIVFSQGEPADAIHYIQKGKVKLAALSKAGKAVVLAILGAGDFW